MASKGHSLEGLRILSPLGKPGRMESLLVADPGAGRGRKWVLKRILERGPGPLRSALRADIVDLACLRHEAFAFPSRFSGGDVLEKPFLLRPYVDGLDLETASAALRAKDCLTWLVSAADALSVLHGFGIPHGNVKASNIIVPEKSLFSRGSGGGCVVLCDPAWWPDGEPRRPFSRPQSSDVSSSGPSGPEPRSLAADLYALGWVFYGILTKRSARPAGKSFPPPPTRFDPEIPVDLERVVLRLLNPDPLRRYRDAAALADDLRRLAGPRAPEPPEAPDAFLDRAREVSLALSRWKDSGPVPAIAVTGEAGVGKSAFLGRLALEAQIEGYPTVLVRCFADPALPQAAARDLADRIIPRGPSGRALRARLRRCLAPEGRRGRQEPSGRPDGREGGAPAAREIVEICWQAAAGRSVIVLVDDVHLASPLTVEVLSDLVRRMTLAARGAPGVGTGPRLAIAFRDESPFRQGLRSLLDALEAPGGGHLPLELSPLDARTVEEWIQKTIAGRPDLRERLRAAGMPSGNPLAVREAIRGGSLGLPAKEAGDPSSLYLAYLGSLGVPARDLLETLAILGRPASASLLSALLSLSEPRIAPLVAPLVRDGTLLDDRGLIFFQHGSLHSWLVRTIEEKRRLELHGRIAAALEKEGSPAAGEVARHWLGSGSPSKGLDAAIAAARMHAARHEPRKALEFYPRALDLIPPSEVDLRRRIVGETAEAHAQVGDHGRAIELLAGLLREAGPAEYKARLHGRIGVFHHRAGDISSATRHLEEALSLLGGSRSRETLREKLRLESELAEIASNKGDYRLAEAISRRALDALSEKTERDPAVLREKVVLLETLAHLKLRQFSFSEARENFEESLRISERIGAHAERSLILNNLGILHIQENRFRQAIACYQKARRLATRLGDAQGLLAVLSNLAILHAKTGDLEAADEALRAAAADAARSESPRTRFLFLHSAGLVDHLSGRYASAIENLRGAVDLGEELRDRHTVAFDLVYLGECHLLRGESKAARAALDRAASLEGPLPAPVPAMVEARRRLAAAMRGDLRGGANAVEDGGGPSGDGGAAHSEVVSGAGVAAAPDAAETIGARPAKGLEYLGAWNGVLLGWADRLAGRLDDAASRLEAARTFFARTGVPSGEIHATLELAACDILRGRTSRAERRLRATASRHTCGRGPLRNPMLAARLLAYQTWLLLEGPRPDLTEAASLLVESESYLIGRRIHDLDVLVRQLRRRLNVAMLDSEAAAPLPVRPVADTQEGLESLRSLGELADELVLNFEDELGSDRTASLRSHLREFQRRLDESRRALEGRAPAVGELVRADAILGVSAAIGRVRSMVSRLAGSPFPILISGETGAGKEVVARAIHGESPRSSAPFVSIACAALPAELLEAELFGYSRGAFTGAEGDKPGLLLSASGGTFFFDEVGEMPLELQAKVLRLLDRLRVRPLGGTEEVAVDVRFLFSTNRDLRRLVDESRFRSDLFFRLGAFEIRVPPLRERLEDLPILVDHFVRCASGAEEPPPFDDDVLPILAAYSWPGNVRELRNAVIRLTLTSCERVRAEDARRTLGKAVAARIVSPDVLRSRKIEEILEDVEREYLVELHRDCGGDLKAMARRLGIRVRALYDRLRRVGIQRKELR